LPKLLAGSQEIVDATEVSINENGEVVLSAAPLRLEPGDIAVHQTDSGQMSITSQNATLSAANNLFLNGSQLETTGDLNLLAGHILQVRDSDIPFLAKSGGDLTLQGHRAIDIVALNHPDNATALQAVGDITLISPEISLDTHLSAENVAIFNEAGDSGDFISLYDPIFSANGDVNFGNYTGRSLKIEAGGQIVGGNITITGPDTTLSNSTDPDAEILRSSAALILRSGVSSLANAANIPPDGFDNTFFSGTEQPAGNNISVGFINTAGGPVILDSPSEIFASEISTGGGDITLNAIADIQLNGSVNSSGGNIEITTGNFFRVLSSFTNDNGVNASISSAGNGDGRITIRHQGGVETPFIIGDATTNGTAGAIASNSEVISPTFEVPVPPSVYTQGNITIITSAPGDNTDAILPPPEPLPDTDDTTDDNSDVIPVAPAPTNNNDPIVSPETSAADEFGSQRFSVSDPAADEVGSERFSVSDPAADEVGSQRFSVSDPAADEVGSERFSVSDPATDEVGSERFSVSDPAADEVGSQRFSVSDPATDEVGSERFSVSDPATDEVGSQRFSVSDPATDEVGSQRFSVSDPEISLETQTVLDQNLNRKTLEPLEYPGFLSTERILYLDVTVLPLAFASEELGAIGNQEAIAISSEVAAITEFSQVNDAAFTNTTNTGVEVELTASFSQGSEALADINSVNSVSFSNRTTNGTTNAIINTNPTTNGITNAATGIFAAAMGDRTSVSSATSTTATATANNSTSNSSQSANNSTSNSSQSANNSTSNSSQSANNSTSTSNSSQEQSSSASNEASMEKLQETMADGDMVGTVWQIEQMRNQEIEQLFGITAELDEQEVAITAFQNTLRELAAETGKEAAILYVLAQTEQLELILVTSEGTPIRTSVPEATRDVLFPVVQEFRKEVTDPRRRGKTTYLASAQQLYEWLISPIEDTLTDLGIETLMFSMGQGCGVCRSRLYTMVSNS
jgi:hypothetical protein